MACSCTIASRQVLVCDYQIYEVIAIESNVTRNYRCSSQLRSCDIIFNAIAINYRVC